MMVQSDSGSSGAVHRIVLIVIALALIVPAAWAISLYDIIELTKKGYRDDQIIAIIDATGSRFQTDADTIVALKREGVREKVIQAVITATDGPPPADERQQPAATTRPGDPSWRTASSDRRERTEEPKHAHADVTVTPLPPRSNGRSTPISSAPVSFATLPFEEGPAGHHHHYAVALGEVPIIILRAEAGFPSVADRARAAAHALNRAAAAGATIVASHHGVVARTPDGVTAEVLKVDRGDVIGLQRRSAGRIAPERVAAYWAAVLDDYLDLAAGREPTRLTSSGIGDVQALYREVARGAERLSPVSSDLLLAAIDRLPGDNREALIDLAGYVPAKFRFSEETP